MSISSGLPLEFSILRKALKECFTFSSICGCLDTSSNMAAISEQPLDVGEPSFCLDCLPLVKDFNLAIMFFKDVVALPQGETAMFASLANFCYGFTTFRSFSEFNLHTIFKTVKQYGCFPIKILHNSLVCSSVCLSCIRWTLD